jgi:hypothetical protein
MTHYDSVAEGDSVFTENTEENEEVLENEKLIKHKYKLFSIDPDENGGYTVSLNIKTRSEKDKVTKPENFYVNLYKKLSRYVGSAILVHHYLQTNDLSNSNFLDKMLYLVVPSTLGYTFGKFITPVSVLLYLQKFIK